MVDTVKKVREIVNQWLREKLPDIRDNLGMGLPEIDDRYNAWRIPLTYGNGSNIQVGEIRVDKAGEVIIFTKPELIRNRAKKLEPQIFKKKSPLPSDEIRPAPIPNKVILGDAGVVLEEFPHDTAQLIITSPPYFNAKPEYSEFVDYQEYLDFLRRIIIRIHSILSEGRFFIINVSPILIRRTSRTNSSKRIALPFDVHSIIVKAGFEFIDDIIWVKPEGAGWNTGRGRRFAADRQPLQYKPVPVTEYVLVYRKETDKLIDWNIRKHYNKKFVLESKINGEYDVTNVWRIPPGHHREHPAVFPEELIRRLIRYYSFKHDLVLDPFAGSGTVGRVALDMDRRFLLIDNNPQYFKIMRKEISKLYPLYRIDFEINEDFDNLNGEIL
jgi:DNA modification methylase